MAEISLLWTTDGTGDGSTAGYTQVHWGSIGQVLAACCGFEGVAPGYLNSLACTANGANTVAVNTGGALVDGRPYVNGASVDVDVPSASGAGNTRIDRIVLRADWSAQTVRITRIAGTDAATPSAPSITQTSGTTYDIQLCRVLVDTSGTVTVTDERVYAAAGTTALDDSAVTSAKIADDAVDDAKVGNRVPQFDRRLGGNSTNWNISGHNAYVPGMVRMQGGKVMVASTPVSVKFPVAFSAPPLVYATLEKKLFIGLLAVSAVTTAGFSVELTDTDGEKTIIGYATWLAVGPE